MAKIEKTNEFTIIWNDDETVGLQFKEGKPMQLYDKSVVVESYDLPQFQGEIGLERLEKEIESLVSYAMVQYPMEFAEMP